MSDMEFDRGDHELFAMMAGGHGPGGELPGKFVPILPADRAERICELDMRIQELKRVWPICIRLVICLAIISAVAVGWIHPVIGGAMEFVYLLQLLFAWRNAAPDDKEEN